MIEARTKVMKRVRFNFSDIKPEKIKPTAQGGIVVQGAVLRTGVFVYRTEDGGAVREYLPANELFRKASMDTLKGAPVTNEHPEEMITPDNYKGNSIGFVDNVRNEHNQYLVADLYINDAETIRQIMEDEKRELSAGYFTDPIMQSGISHDGEEYDAIQRNIVFNHCSLVEMGRAGPSVSLRLNSKGNQLPASEVRTLADSELFKDEKVSEARKYVIREEDGKFCLYTKDGNEKIACHDTLQKAEEQEKAILISKQNDLEETKDEKMTIANSEKSEKKNVEQPEAKENSDTEEKLNAKQFEQKVQAEVDARLTLLVAAKQLNVKDLSSTLPKEELALRIVETTKPHMNLEGRSEEFMQALLEDSLSQVDIDSFWVSPAEEEKSEEQVEVAADETPVAEASSELEIEVDVSELDSEAGAEASADEQAAPEPKENGLNKILSSLRAGKKNSKFPASDFDSVEQQALRWRKYSR